MGKLGDTPFFHRLLQQPILEYTRTEKLHDQEKTLTYEITNISTDAVFTDLTFVLLLKDSRKGKFIDADLLLPAPLVLTKEESGKEVFPEYVQFFLPELQPNSTIMLSARLSGNMYPTLRFSSKGQQPVVLEVSSLKTFIIRYELYITLAFFVSCIIAILFFITYLRKNVGKEAVANRQHM